jgi:hypothetical protein
MVSVLAGHGNPLSTPLKYVEPPRPRSSCFISTSQDNLVLPLDPSSLPDHILAQSRLPPRPFKGLDSILSHYTSLLFALDRHPTCHWPGHLTLSYLTFTLYLSLSNQPTKRLTKGGVLRKRTTSSLVRLNHSSLSSFRLTHTALKNATLFELFTRFFKAMK